MKLTKLAILATTAMLALGVSSAKADYLVTNYSKITVSGVIITNNATIYKGDKEIDTTTKVKFGNKQLLDVLASWAGVSSFPAGAQLVVCWQSGTNYGDTLVIDKAGTNMLFNCYNGAPYAEFYVDFDYEYGAYNETYLDAAPGYDKWVEWNSAYFYFYDDYYDAYYTDLWAYGGTTQKFSQAWDASGNYTKWSDSQSAIFPYTGDQYFLWFGSDTTLSVKVKAKGKGLGRNQYWY